MQWHRLQRLITVVCGLVCVLVFVCQARAQAPISADRALSRSGLPGMWTGVSPRPAEPSIQVAARAGYGFTEGYSLAPGEHHRLSAQLSATARPLPWLAASASTHFRHDRHVSDALGGDQGTTLDSSLAVVVGTSVTPSLHWGGLLDARFRDAGEIGLSLSNPTLDALLLAQFEPANTNYQLLAQFGYRLDFSGNTAGEASRYRAGDRLALGVSDFDALLLNVGGQYLLGETLAFAELGGSVLLGEQAPEPLQSPLWLTVGMTQAINQAMAWSLIVDGSLSGRRTATNTNTHLPIAPRIAVMAGLSFVFGNASAYAAPRPPSTIEVPVVVKAEPTAILSVKVRSPEGDPLSDARVFVVREQERTEVPHVNLETYRLEKLAMGTVSVSVQAERMQAYTSTVDLNEPEVELEVQLQAAGTRGQIRGVVRSFSGVGLLTQIRIEPLGEKRTTSADGHFEIDVPPGRYDIVLKAVGHQRQRRSVKVKAGGVVILNADLRRGMP